MRVYDEVPSKLSEWDKYESDSALGDFDYEVYVETGDGGRRQYLILSENSSKYYLMVTPGDKGGSMVGIGKTGRETGRKLESYWSPEVAVKAAVLHNKKSELRYGAMDKRKVASELVKIARGLRTADAGDVAIYLNISEFVERLDGERMLDKEQAAIAESILESAVVRVRGKIRDLVKREVMRAEDKLEDVGLTIR